jgi:hypothetical protein
VVLPLGSDDSDLALAEVTLARAKEVLGLELGSADIIDLKSVGLATADVAALTILVAAHGGLGYWWVPAMVMGCSGFCFFLVLRQRVWLFGPDFTKFRDEHAGLSRLEITEGMLADVLACGKNNEPFLKFKARWFRYGYRLLALSLIALAFIAALAPMT